ncbi:hypothetical protein PVAP13_7NG400750 [Panicum virgatum]|uniref:Uncharacterized protein n=1 Tax=Panicum virgatum TaxID=38727 RepID=A0A8T0Q607_PANVG|nr:hypothetical protein PVAP13_7NG400750 [Panicum virgatum]
MFGFGFPGQGFHCLEIPGLTKKKSTDHMGLIQIKSGEANVEKVEEELKYLIDAKWHWKVRKICETEYLATFPNKMILDTFSRSKSIDLAFHNISATIAQSDLDRFVSSVLQTGWVQMYNIPDFTKSIEAVTLIAELAGEVLVVDEVSLIKEGPVRVKLRARDLSALRDYKEISIADIGYEIKFVAEKSV